METDVTYEQLSPAAFEQLAVALAESVIGAGMEVYGPGPDGGREATYDGPIRWSATGDEGDTWRGYTVVQAKQCQNPSDPATNLRWLNGQLREELEAWMDPDSRRSRFPRYLLVITNVRLSPADPGGGIDTLRDALDKRLKHNYGTGEEPRTLGGRGLLEVKVWHRDKLNTLVTNNESVRKRFGPLLTPGDVLARVGRLPGLIPIDQIPGLLVDHAQIALASGRWVRFDEAGDGSNSRSVERVIVDLPARDQDAERGLVIRSVLARGDQVLSGSRWRATEAGQAPSARHVVITGAPGNSKSTLVKYLTQVYRAAFARTDANEPAIQTLIASTDESLERLGVAGPKSPRWPLRVELAAMATEMGPNDGGPSIGRYLCDQINLSCSVPVGTVNLRSCGRSANRISLIRHTRPGESRRRTGENRPRTAQVDSAPLGSAMEVRRLAPAVQPRSGIA